MMTPRSSGTCAFFQNGHRRAPSTPTSLRHAIGAGGVAGWSARNRSEKCQRHSGLREATVLFKFGFRNDFEQKTVLEPQFHELEDGTISEEAAPSFLTTDLEKFIHCELRIHSHMYRVGL